MRGFLHGCPRCAGDVFVEDDPYVGALLICLQYGHTLSQAEERALRAVAALARRSSAA